MYDFDQCFHTFDWCRWQYAVSEIDDMSGALDVVKQRAGTGARRRGARKQNRRIDVALYGTIRALALQRCKFDSPVRRNDLCRQLRICLDEMRRMMRLYLFARTARL